MLRLFDSAGSPKVRGPPHCSSLRWNTSKRFERLVDLPPSKLLHVVWLHIPKSGGSNFANVLFRAACRCKTPTPFHEAIEVRCIHENVCPGAFDVFDWGHAPLTPLKPYQMAVTIMRTPWRRATSGFFYNLHDCPLMQHRANMTEHRPPPGSAAFYRTFSPSHVRSYAKCITACATRMLSGLNCAQLSTRELGGSSLRMRANATLHRFSFVGLQDEWNRTLAAFSRTFLTPVQASDVAVLRPGPRPPVAYEHVATIMRDTPFVDDALLPSARRILDLEERGVWTPIA
jgi:hypothetical protein